MQNSLEELFIWCNIQLFLHSLPQGFSFLHSTKTAFTKVTSDLNIAQFNEQCSVLLKPHPTLLVNII